MPPLTFARVTTTLRRIFTVPAQNRHTRVLIRHTPPRSVERTMSPARSPLSKLRDHRQKSLGARGEALAAAHLERLGYTVLARNHRTRYGELDLVLSDGAARTIVFVEVKTRLLGSGDPWDNLHEAKRAQVRSMATAWLNEVRDRPWAADLRFDAIGVTLDSRGALVRLDHLEGAF
jgi:putative endonuclease